MAKIEMSLDELMSLLADGGMINRKTVKSRKPLSVSKVTKTKKPRKKTAWDRFLKSFKFRNRRKSEKPSAYLSARSKAAGRAYRKKNRGKN